MPSGGTHEHAPSERRPADPAADRFMATLYVELRALARRYLRRERPGHTLQTTALVHEAYLRLANQGMPVESKEQFLALAAGAVRRILVDHARRHAVRGKGIPRVSLEDVEDGHGAIQADFLALDEALEKLARTDDRQSRVVELRFFAGMSVDETARALAVSPRTVDGEWKAARTWLARELSQVRQ